MRTSESPVWSLWAYLVSAHVLVAKGALALFVGLAVLFLVAGADLAFSHPSFRSSWLLLGFYLHLAPVAPLFLRVLWVEARLAGLLLSALFPSLRSGQSGEALSLLSLGGRELNAFLGNWLLVWAVPIWAFVALGVLQARRLGGEPFLLYALGAFSLGWGMLAVRDLLLRHTPFGNGLVSVCGKEERKEELSVLGPEGASAPQDEERSGKASG